VAAADLRWQRDGFTWNGLNDNDRRHDRHDATRRRADVIGAATATASQRTGVRVAATASLSLALGAPSTAR